MKYLHLIAAGLLSTGALFAQSTSMTPTDQPAAKFEADATADYAFRLKTTGGTIDLGANLTPNQFLGFEYAYYGPDGNTNDPIAGTIHSKEDIDTFQAAYRFSVPLSQFCPSMDRFPLRIYLGGGAGIADVRLKSSVPAFGLSNSSSDDGVLSASGVAGLEWWVTRNIAAKVGFRYIYLNHVTLYGQTGRIDSAALEYGVAVRW